MPRWVVAGAGALAFAFAALMLAPAGRSAENAPAVAGKLSAPTVRYGRDIRPLLSDRCFRCHGPDAKTRAADLRLDLRELATAARKHGAAIVPGKPEESELWKRVTAASVDDRMPPASSNKKYLSPEELELVRRWIADGAPYEPHWSFVPPARPAVPEVRDPATARNPIDRFIVAELDRQGIAPSPEAPRDTLIRRLFLDVTGLPPTPEETDAFLADPRPDAYEQWVDKLLTTEPYKSRYAERMAVPWLDASRYADTCGIHMDAGRQMWLWRDWVLNAFRDNVPFDRFVTEQMAGDLLPDATMQQRIASGFNRNHVTTDEGGAIPEEYLVEYAVDRASTTGSVFLGLTVGCARCHDHKYDPLPQDEFYKFYSFFNSIEEPGLYSQMPNPNRAFEPFLVVASPEQQAQLASLRGRIDDLNAELGLPAFQDEVRREAFEADLIQQSGLAWESSRVIAAASVYGATMAVQPDGSVMATRNNPDRDEHLITLRTPGRDLRLLMVEALPLKNAQNRVGRSPNGNAVLTSVDAVATSVADPSKQVDVRFTWAWADIEQGNGDFRAVNVLDDWDERGWAVEGMGPKGGRVALLLADKSFGFEGGTNVRVRLRYDSIYPQHTLGRVRLTLARFNDAGLERLGVGGSGWYQVGPFPAVSKEAAYKTAFGPETGPVTAGRSFGESKLAWSYAEGYKDGVINTLPSQGLNATYVARRLFAASPRQVDVSLGSDDGFVLFLNGKQVAAREIDRGAAPDQDKVTLDLPAGESTLVLKIVNTSGPGGFYFSMAPRKGELSGDLVASLLPDAARPTELRPQYAEAWRLAYSDTYRQQRETLAAEQKRLPELEAQAPRTMVMKELPTPRETYVLVRGQYDKPDKKRPLTRDIFSAFGSLPENAPKNRLGLAQWLTSEKNPLVARVAVNRYWEMLFGTGIVKTSEDFGLQGDWPSHPELLDWLAVEFRESGWDTRHMLRLMLTSATYRRSSTVRPDALERDPENRLLAYYPRHRLNAETIRDQALYVSGLLVEKLGGPSVKPYQPDGLWQEVAMLQSNTREYKRGEGSELWRRSLYTYWKRACPPPSLMTFDAPTRESCTIRRASTNTPLQALVLWNDEQHVEASRLLATRTLQEKGDDAARLTKLFRRCTGRTPDATELKKIGDALNAYRARYRAKPEDAASLLKVGVTPAAKDLDAPEVAAWTMIGNAILNLSATITQS